MKKSSGPKADKPVNKPKKRGPKSLADKLLAEVEEAYDYMKKRFENHELEYYMDKGYAIKGRLVDEDEDITAEQVAILGGYSLVAQLRDNLKDIMEGKTPAKKSKVSDVEMIKLDTKSGKSKTIKLPPEVKKQLLEMLENMEEEDE